jgi:hypothetical protein
MKVPLKSAHFIVKVQKLGKNLKLNTHLKKGHDFSEVKKKIQNLTMSYIINAELQISKI